MWTIASIPFWIMGAIFLVGGIASIKWSKPTTDDEVKHLVVGLVGAGIFFLIAAKVAG